MGKRVKSLRTQVHAKTAPDPQLYVNRLAVVADVLRIKATKKLSRIAALANEPSPNRLAVVAAVRIKATKKQSRTAKLVNEPSPVAQPAAKKSDHRPTPSKLRKASSVAVYTSPTAGRRRSKGGQKMAIECIGADTMMTMYDGRRVRLRDIKIGDELMDGLTPGKKAAVKQIFPSDSHGKKMVTWNKGPNLTGAVTRGHPMWTRHDESGQLVVCFPTDAATQDPADFEVHERGALPMQLFNIETVDGNAIIGGGQVFATLGGDGRNATCYTRCYNKKLCDSAQLSIYALQLKSEAAGLVGCEDFMRLIKPLAKLWSTYTALGEEEMVVKLVEKPSYFIKMAGAILQEVDPLGSPEESFAEADLRSKNNSQVLTLVHNTLEDGWTGLETLLGPVIRGSEKNPGAGSVHKAVSEASGIGKIELEATFCVRVLDGILTVVHRAGEMLGLATELDDKLIKMINLCNELQETVMEHVRKEFPEMYTLYKVTTIHVLLKSITNCIFHNPRAARWHIRPGNNCSTQLKFLIISLLTSLVTCSSCRLTTQLAIVRTKRQR
jgi:hypothetical protein